MGKRQSQYSILIYSASYQPTYCTILRVFQLALFSNKKEILRFAQNDNLCRPERSEGFSLRYK